MKTKQLIEKKKELNPKYELRIGQIVAFHFGNSCRFDRYYLDEQGEIIINEKIYKLKDITTKL
jgi:hypothetical protein